MVFKSLIVVLIIILIDCGLASILNIHQNSERILFSAQNVIQNSNPGTAWYAIDNNPTTYSATDANGPTPATWQGLLNSYANITAIIITRANCCPSPSTQDCCPFKFQDITVEIMDFTGNITEDFNISTGGESKRIDTLNRNNLLHDPVTLSVDYSLAPKRGNFVRIMRMPSSSGTTQEARTVLGMSEVEVIGIIDICSTCNVNADCVGAGSKATCQCRTGYYGDGLTCQATLGAPQISPIVVHEVTTTWQTVPFPKTFFRPITICTPNYEPMQQDPVVVRLRITASSFEIRLQNPNDYFVKPTTVYCIVVEHGVYDGMEAFKYTEENTDNYGNFVGSVKSCSGRYNRPVVLGQVITSNDQKWVTFWASDVNQTSLPPSGTQFRLGKHSGNDIRPSDDEFIGYIIIESEELSTGNNTFLSIVTPPLNQNDTFSVNTTLDFVGAVLSPAGIVSPYWPIVTSVSSSQVHLFNDVDLPSRSNPDQDHVALIAFSGQIFVFPAEPCYNHTNECDCTAYSQCAWCSFENQGMCYPNDAGTQAYCISSENFVWTTKNPACTETPTMPPNVEPETPTMPPVVPRDKCRDFDVCECLTFPMECAWCKSPTIPSCLADLPINEGSCKNQGGIWISGSTTSCTNETETHSASSTLSAMGHSTSISSAQATLAMGCILFAGAIVIFIYGIMNGVKRRYDAEL